MKKIFVECLIMKLLFYSACCPTAGVTGKGGIWQEKPKAPNHAKGAESPEGWAVPALVRVHAVLG
jgi:hypothetical protein